MSGCPADRISNIPCDVINQILSHLPLPDAVRTSILSREWQYKWVTIPRLSFNCDFEDHFDDYHDLVSTIDQILTLHKGYVVKSSIINCGAENLLAVNRWLFFLSDHRIQDLVISYSGWYNDPMIPIHLFAFDHLTHLKMESCEVKLPPTFKGFIRLVRLDLIDVVIESRYVEMWLSKCPILEYFYMEYCRVYMRLDIDAPNLKFFHFVGWLDSICIKNSNLEEISISCNEACLLEGGVEEHFELADFRGSESNLFKVLGHTLSLKKLFLDFSTVPYLAEGGLPCKLLNDLSQLTLIELSSFIFGCMMAVACALCLIRSSPNLQSLKISASDCQFNTSEGAVVRYLKEKQEKCDVPHSCLKYVKICGLSNTEHEMELLKLLLRLATALEKLEIESKFSKSHDKQDGYEMLKEIATFQRASSRAVIIIHI